MITMTQTKRKAMLPLSTFAVFFALVVPAAAADLELWCKPLYAQQDSRGVRPEYTSEVSAQFTYYLFDNRDLLHYRVQLVNNSPEPIELGNLNWPDQLELTVRRNSEILPADAVRLKLLRRTRVDPVYYLEGRRLERVDFQRRANGFGSEPLQETDNWGRETHEVDKLPLLLETYQQAGVEIALVDPAGEPLSPGVYRINFNDPQTGRSCSSEHQIVMRHPESDLDRVESRVVRYSYLKALGEPAAAGVELELAYETAPDNLTAMYYFALHAAEMGDRDLQVKMIEKIRDLLRTHKAKFPDSTIIRSFSIDAVNSLDQIRLEADAARTKKGKGLVDREGGVPID
jgi:hypothetical protein